MPLMHYCTRNTSTVGKKITSAKSYVKYHQVSNIRCTKSPNVPVSRLVLQWIELWSQVLEWRCLKHVEWRLSWSSADRRCSNFIWVISNFIANSGVTYIRGLIVCYNLLVVHWLSGHVHSSQQDRWWLTSFLWSGPVLCCYRLFLSVTEGANHWLGAGLW